MSTWIGFSATVSGYLRFYHSTNVPASFVVSETDIRSSLVALQGRKFNIDTKYNF